ncbi:MAG: hypothetical protein LBS36_02180 [Oscillospiraceae bacterium]|jgi:hypothetical protein|nr:hypothetical protein [Oscillospiraceae bacterium]
MWVLFAHAAKYALILMLVLSCLTACGQSVTPETSTDAAATASNQFMPQKVAPEAPISELEWENYKFPLLALNEEKGLYLYGVWPRGVVLYTGNTGQFFDWGFDSPRRFYPKIFTGDFDKDGDADVAISVYAKSGTGLSVEDLHLLKKVIDSYGWHYSDYAVSEDALEAQLQENITYRFHEHSISLLYNGAEQIFSVAEYTANPQEPVTLSGVNYTNIISYEQEGDQIIASFGAGFTAKEYAAPTFFATVRAAVQFMNSGIRLKDIQIQPIDSDSP